MPMIGNRHPASVFGVTVFLMGASNFAGKHEPISFKCTDEISGRDVTELALIYRHRLDRYEHFRLHPLVVFYRRRRNLFSFFK